MGTKNEFTQKLAMFVVGFSCLIVIMLFFVEVPEANQRIVDMVLGVIVGSGLVSVINYFFQSHETKDPLTISKNKDGDIIH
jgi:riboflavin transporter FmnP